MKPITHKEIKAARYAVLLRNLSVVAEKLATYIEDNPTDLQGAKSALRHVRRIVSAKTTAHIERRMPPAEAALFVDSWNDLATGLASIAPKQ